MPVTSANVEPVAAPQRSLPSRVFGVVMSPRATYASVAAHPRTLGVLLTVIVVTAACTFAFLSSETGQTALLDAQIERMEAFGRPMTDAQIQQMERFLPMSAYVSLAGTVVTVPAMALAIAGIGFAVLNTTFGANATFRQALAVVSHSLVLTALAAAFSMPLFFARGSMSSATSLAVFFPMLDDAGFLARLLGMIDLFRIWWLVSLAIGFGVLYRRRTAPIAWAFLLLYGIIAVGVAAVMTGLSGA
jgi:hypothetical protein